MQHVIVGLGNPGGEYQYTRHNTGRLVLEIFRKKIEAPEWESDKKLRALVSEGRLKKHKLTLLEPETFMNNSGKAVAPLVKSKKAAENLIIIYDDLDLPLGSMKISFNRGDGGHNGLKSVIRAVKTPAFVRLRVGICPVTPSGKPKKPHGEKEVEAHILGTFKEKEFDALKKIGKKAAEALERIVLEGREKAMGEFN